MLLYSIVQLLWFSCFLSFFLFFFLSECYDFSPDQIIPISYQCVYLIDVSCVYRALTLRKAQCSVCRENTKNVKRGAIWRFRLKRAINESADAGIYSCVHRVTTNCTFILTYLLTYLLLLILLIDQIDLHQWIQSLEELASHLAGALWKLGTIFSRTVPRASLCQLKHHSVQFYEKHVAKFV